MVNWRTLLPEQNEIQFGKKRNRKRETAARKKDLRTKLKGFSKLAGKMEVAAQKASTPSNSVEESLRRFFALTMILRSPLDIHTRLELSGKRNWVPQRFLIQPPKQKTGTMKRSNAPKQLENNKSTFDKAAEQVATAFGHENTEVHERMRSLLQIFSYYSTLGLDGIRRHNFKNFIKLIDYCQLAKYAEYRQTDQVLCWQAFAKIKQQDANYLKIGLNFEQFVSGFPELVPHVFRTSSKPPKELSEILVNEHILLRANRVRSDPLTLALLWNEKAQEVLSKFQWQLQVIFKHFADLYEDALDTAGTAAGEGPADVVGSAGINIGGTQTTARTDLKAWMQTPGVDDTMDWKEFLRLLECFGIVGSRVSQLSISRARQLFDEANLSEIADADVDRLCWHEYVEALGRCALEMYPLQDSRASKLLNIDKAEVTFMQTGRVTTTTGVKSAVESAFHGGPTARPPIHGKRIFRQLSPRAKLFRDKGWRNTKKQAEIGTVSWGRDVFVQKSGSFEQPALSSKISAVSSVVPVQRRGPRAVLRSAQRVECINK